MNKNMAMMLCTVAGLLQMPYLSGQFMSKRKPFTHVCFNETCDLIASKQMYNLLLNEARCFIDEEMECYV
jgi:hypothetical protein